MSIKPILLSTLLLVGSFSALAIEDEDHYNQQFCKEMQGKAENTLDDLSRVDCLTDTHAFEADWADGLKVYESIGQALYYAAESERLPGILLLIRKDNSEKHIRKVQRVIETYRLNIKLHTLDTRTHVLGSNIKEHLVELTNHKISDSPVEMSCTILETKTVNQDGLLEPNYMYSYLVVS